jgi:hypothetical protein
MHGSIRLLALVTVGDLLVRRYLRSIADASLCFDIWSSYVGHCHYPLVLSHLVLLLGTGSADLTCARVYLDATHGPEIVLTIWLGDGVLLVEARSWILSV